MNVTNMRHMDCLRDVALTDVAHLEAKERTYRGSWKKRGGVGAFMMLARKWDRLESMLSDVGEEKASRAWDIFWAIAEAPDGRDGTPLAEIRDLRRYLLLAESEMVARGSVVLPERPRPTVEELERILQEPTDPVEVMADGTTRAIATDNRVGPNFSALDGAVLAARLREAAHLLTPMAGVSAEQESFYRAMIREAAQRLDLRGQSVVHQDERPGTPADGGHHEPVYQYPFVISSALGRQLPMVAQTLYCEHHRDYWVLEPAITADQKLEISRAGDSMSAGETRTLLRAAVRSYEGWNGWYVLRVAETRSEDREFWPVLRREINFKEHGELPAWQRALYLHDSGAAKWVLRYECAAWARD